MINKALAASNPNECANLILDRMRAQSSYNTMHVVATAFTEEVKIIKKHEPVRVIHMTNLLKYRKWLDECG